MELETQSQSVNLPVHMHAYIHATDRINISGLFREAIRKEMRRDDINIGAAREAFTSLSDDSTIVSSDYTTELDTIRRYQQFVRTNGTHEQQTAIDD